LNGKKNEWEAVVKIPFIDEVRLLGAMRTREHLLTAAERRRNTFGSSFIFFYDDNSIGISFPSPVPTFPEIAHCKTRMEPFHLPILTPGQYLKKGLHQGVKLGKEALAGFPSLQTIPHDASLICHEIKVFNAPSRNESIVLALRNPITLPSTGHYDADAVAKQLVGQRAFVGWPFLTEAVVVAIADGENYWEPAVAYGGFVSPRKPNDADFAVKRTPLSRDQADFVVAQSNRIENQYSNRFGVLLDPVGATTIIYACLLQGMKRLDNGAIVKDFGAPDSFKLFSLGTLVTSVSDMDKRFEEKPAPPIEQEFPVG
jgi:5'-3' exoribonuclease 1